MIPTLQFSGKCGSKKNGGKNAEKKRGKRREKIGGKMAKNGEKGAGKMRKMLTMTMKIYLTENCDKSN